MPKIVDPAQRRQLIFDALFDVVVEAGIEQASLRRVADAAGLAIGSVRHYFPTHEELITGAAQEVIDRISTRLKQHRERPVQDGERADVVEQMLCELLPLETHTTREVTIWLEIVVAARTNSALAPAADQLMAGSHVLAQIIVDRSETPPSGASIAAEQLAATIDGLALRGVLRPDRLPPETARAVVRHHLAQLRS